MTATVDVVIVGAGPTGLTAAGDLARAGRTVVVLEKRPAPNPSSRAFATMARTLEVLDARGLADDLIARGHRAPGVSLFAGARIDLGHLDSPYPFVLVTPQTNIDRALEGYARDHGAAIRRGVEVVGIDQDADGATVTARTPESADDLHWRAGYVVGADGAHSAVRTLLGVDFPGKTILSSLVLADVKLADGPAGRGLTVGSTRDALGFLAPYDRRDTDESWYRAMVWDRHHQVPDDVPADGAEVGRVLARAFGADPGLVDVSWTSRFHCDERQVTQYRHGRVFLAGDAAHVHSPMGGQGMNTGIQDAANLAWKIDAVLAGAADALLDTYHAERHPIGRRVLRQSGLMARGITLRPRAARWLRNLLAPGLLRIPAIRDTVAGSFAGTGLRYPGTGLVGTRATQIPLSGGRLTELLRRPGFVLVRERGAAVVDSFDGQQAERSDDGPAVLVRPDGYIAWAGDSADEEWAAALPLTASLSECGSRR
ncbi:FAD-dependent oxidoreductase [Mycobacterium sp. IS-1496]|uniref:FAD-dependent oxidoreductase n=1 Tax=Mycobacterium sp. IS-1496 TaxID=1772284 RepID=UPI0007417B09|nr:FAD-dependent oxidoreductase [Mycobacterium sp. IS-1496]KUI31069.1 FAD-dependent oxidoreductase [Mycobacterium sp. IS-1496]